MKMGGAPRVFRRAKRESLTSGERPCGEVRDFQMKTPDGIDGLGGLILPSESLCLFATKDDDNKWGEYMWLRKITT